MQTLFLLFGLLQLLYFSADPDAHEGLLRALSVASGTHMPRPPRKPADLAVETTVKIPPTLDKIPSRPSSQVSMAGTEKETEKSAAEQAAAAVTATAAAVIPIDIPESAVNALVPLDALVKVGTTSVLLYEMKLYWLLKCHFLKSTEHSKHVCCPGPVATAIADITDILCVYPGLASWAEHAWRQPQI